MLTRRLAAGLGLLALLAAVPAQSQDAEMAKALRALAITPKGGAAAVQPGWNVPSDGSNRDAPCLMSYRDGLNLVGYIAPTKGWNKGYFVVSGPSVPYADRPTDHRVALVTDGTSNQTVKAIRWPLDPERNQFAFLFELIDFDAALEVMSDEENLAVLEMRETQFNFRQSLFSGSWTGGHAARDKLRACLAAKTGEGSR